ncbi:hypothetical protein H010_06065 [Hydrogenophaga taeniospiralis CCUG 15921]|uniref:Teneurin-like YD-shell domain-containing protein n=1 Tax=Hydrogenophaga taeniospiralis CCUG 15921 TaxID=1281780 RepID=A0A9X4S813_9BURK|nr:hypothetical protein [Hydrogenophaga taeniospiralis CCUG 15921]
MITRVASFEYDAAGMLIKEVIEPDSPDHCLQTTHGYNAQGNPISTSTSACAGASGHAISSAGVARTTTKDYVAQTVTIDGVSYATPAGVFATSSTNALNQSESYEHDPRYGKMTKLIGPNGGITTWAYDSFGRKTRENRADGTYTVWEYKLCQVAGQALDPVCAKPVSGESFTHAQEWYVQELSYGNNGVALAAAQYQIHDTLGRVVRVRSDSFMAEGNAGNRYPSIQDTIYNALGQTAQQSIAYLLVASGSSGDSELMAPAWLQPGSSPRWSSYEYDQLGRVIKETRPDGNGGTAVLQTAYNGLETVTTNALGQVKKTYRNATGQAERVEDAQGQTVLYGYDALGQLTQTNAAGSITKLSYDLRGRKTSMQDPAMGRWDYAYNAFGELVWQQDSLSQAVTIAYDPLGRMTDRIEPDLISHWYYDKKVDGSSCGAGIGKLCEATANNGYRRQHTYDAMGRPTSTSNVLDNATQPAVVTQVYDSVTGRLKEQTWPSGYKALYEYTEAGASWSAGHLWRVRGMDGATQNALWQAKDKDPQGRLVRYQGGNGVVTQRDIEAATGKVNGIQATLNGQAEGNVLKHSYGYDSLGNLLTRSDANTGVAESFSYDTLNRLSLTATLGGGLENQQQVQVLYDARGNIKYKSDVGYYHYDGDRPNRLTAITTTQENWGGAVGTVTAPNAGTKALAYAFDDYLPGVRNINLGQGDVALGNGNLMYTVSQDQAGGAHTVRWEAYTSFNMIREMRFGNLNAPSDPTNATADRTVAFVYGPEHQRLRQTITLTSNAPSHMEAGTTWYMNGPDSLGLSYEKEVKANGLIEHKHYLSAGGESFALHTQREGALGGKPAKAVSYFHNDHLGSLAAISNEAGVVVERLAYDPWGKRRFSDGNKDSNDTLTSTVTDRGYTMHEHMDEMGMINMNGRVFDPAIGRFLTADPHVTFPYDLQSFNRYGYVLNNPLGFTDPTGFDLDGDAGVSEGQQYANENYSSETGWADDLPSSSSFLDDYNASHPSPSPVGQNQVVNPVTSPAGSNELGEPDEPLEVKKPEKKKERRASTVGSLFSVLDNGIRFVANEATFGWADKAEDAMDNGAVGLGLGHLLGGVALGTVGGVENIGLKVATRLFGAAKETTTLYRAVSKAELNDIAANGLRVTEGGYETGKLFATSLEDAAKFGKNNFKLDGIQNYLVKVDVPKSVMDAAHSFTADSMKAVSIAADQLNALKATFINYSPRVK